MDDHLIKQSVLLTKLQQAEEEVKASQHEYHVHMAGAMDEYATPTDDM